MQQLRDLLTSVKVSVDSHLSVWKEKALNDKYTTYFSACAYFPFIGWLFPLYIKIEDVDCQKNAKQGLLLSGFFTSILFFLAFFIVLLPNELRLFHLIIVIIIYVLYLIYFSLCFFGAVRALKGSYVSLPLFGEYVDKIKL